MPYRFKLDEDIADGLVRIGKEQIDRALAQLHGREAGAAIHQARKSIKRLRALLRLVRPGLDKAVYKTMNETLRDAGRALSSTRDEDVIEATLKRLAAEEPSLRPAATRLAAWKASPSDGKGAGHTAARRTAIRLLRKSAAAWGKMELAGDGLGAVEAGLARGLDDLGAAFAAAADGDEEAQHDWRKAVQRHWRHMRLVEAAWPDYFRARADEAKAISGLLGDAQDLALVLARVAALEGDDTVKPHQREALGAHALARRAALRELARARCDRLAAEKPRSHARRAARFWKDAARVKAASPEARAMPVGSDVESGELQVAALAVQSPRSRKSSPGRKARAKRT